MGKLKTHLDEVVKPLWNAAGRCTTDNDHWSNAALGLAGEAGEVADTVKKMLFHKSKDYDDELLLEMGDVMFYWNWIRGAKHWTVAQILDANREKLFKRYADKVRS